MKNTQATHCSDECMLSEVKNSKSVIEFPKNAESWDDESDPWI
ncbi:MAG: hypothetical protein OEW78_09110 [Nitrosopumilus sp.]|nr:hypothetical protein [Nitrosopumilus sp.]MDH5432021.1 hypothetical protein [Nitrosopumilus sp.]